MKSKGVIWKTPERRSQVSYLGALGLGSFLNTVISDSADFSPNTE